MEEPAWLESDLGIKAAFECHSVYPRFVLERKEFFENYFIAAHSEQSTVNKVITEEWRFGSIGSPEISNFFASFDHRGLSGGEVRKQLLKIDEIKFWEEFFNKQLMPEILEIIAIVIDEWRSHEDVVGEQFEVFRGSVVLLIIALLVQIIINL